MLGWVALDWIKLLCRVEASRVGSGRGDVFKGSLGPRREAKKAKGERYRYRSGLGNENKEFYGALVMGRHLAQRCPD